MIQREILDWLETTGLLFWRQNSGLIPIRLGGKTRSGKPRFRFVTLGSEGLPDIISVLPPTGRILGLEVKSASGSLRESQKLFRDRLESCGGYYEVVRSVEDAKEAVKKWLKGTQTSPSEGSQGPSESLLWSLQDFGVSKPVLTLMRNLRESTVSGRSLPEIAVSPSPKQET